MKPIYILFQALLFILLFSCQNTQKIDVVAIEQEILEVHNLSRKYHIEKMANEFVSQLSDDHISVNKGKITRLEKESKTEQVQHYFDMVEFEKWDDIEPPIIRFSDDYSMAYTIVNKELVLTYDDEDNKKTKESTVFSWVAIYTKQNGKWKVNCVASTNEPSITNIID